MNESTNILKLRAYESYLQNIFELIPHNRTCSSIIRDINKLAKDEASKNIGLNFYDAAYKEEFDKYYNKISGGLFECFHIIFKHVFQNDPEVGLKNYKVTTTNNDFGVDATGDNAN
jgi:hypothetical protein